MDEDGNQEESSTEVYDLPFGMSQIRKWKWTRYLPFCPTFKNNMTHNEHDEDEESGSAAVSEICEDTLLTLVV